MRQEEYLLQLQMLEQQANQFEEQLKVIDEQKRELEKLNLDLAEFEKSNQKEIFVEFGKVIFVKAEAPKKEFMIDVGQGVFVKKTADEIKEIIKSQVDKFDLIKPEIAKKIESINLQLDKIVNMAQNERAEEDNRTKTAVKKKVK